MRNATNRNDMPDYTFADILTAPERRGHDREIAILRLAKLKSEKGEGWGFIKNLSASGLMIEVHSGFALGETVTVMLTDDQHLVGSVKWRKEQSVGIEFRHLIDISEVLQIASASKTGRMHRLPRVQMHHPIDVRLGSRLIKADICDISPSGICARTDYLFDPGKGVTLVIPQLSEIGGTVRWQSDDRVGIAFLERVSIDRLMSWLSACYSNPVAGGAEISAIDQDEAMPFAVQPLFTSQAYHVIGHDDLGGAIPIAILSSADLALSHVYATSKYFDRVSVTNENAIELPLIVVRQKAHEERLKFASKAAA